jgi:DNA-binding transcriptional ArsR family regulator
MEMKQAIKALSALASPHRLNIFRMLVRQGPEGLPAGDIASRLGLPSSSLSFHLSQMEAAGLIVGHRVQRQIIYAADTQGIKTLLTYLTADCCNGDPELCGMLPPEISCGPQLADKNNDEKTL